MSKSHDSQTGDQIQRPLGDSPAGPPQPGRHWSFHPWRMIPPLIVLGTITAIAITRFDQLITNHWAYPLTLFVVGLFCGYLVFRARPRRSRPALPYPEP